jgi:hypothetical protein
VSFTITDFYKDDGIERTANLHQNDTFLLKIMTGDERHGFTGMMWRQSTGSVIGKALHCNA